MFISSLASGSSGNCFLLKENKDILLIDIGISFKQILSRMLLLNENPNNIKAVFLTHGHVDHVRALSVFLKFFDVPIYATEGTFDRIKYIEKKDNFISIKNNDKIFLSNLEINVFPKSHDCFDPIFLKIKSLNSGKIASFITDFGELNKKISDTIKDSDFLAIESNHDVSLLKRGPYPYFLKKRILSSKGHFSNEDSALAVFKYASPKLRNILLCHLSEINNTPELAIETFRKLINERDDLRINIKVAPRHSVTEVFYV